jgi:PAS domain S-box-containing protein
MLSDIDSENIFLQALLESSPEYIFIKDRQSRFVITNTAHARLMLGLTNPKDAVGKTDFDLFPGREADARRFYDEEQLIMQTGQSVLDREWQVPIAGTGDFVWVSEHKRPIRDKAGEIIGLLGMSRDITAHKQAELAKERLTRQLQIAVDVTTAVNRLLDPQELITQVVDLIRNRFDLYYVGLFLVEQRGTLYEQPGEYVYLRAASGEAGQELLKKGHKLRVDRNSMVGQCVRSGQPCVTANVQAEKNRFNNPLLPDTQAELALPLMSRKETIGALSVQSTQAAAFNEQDISVLQVVAGQLAISLENAYLYRQVETELEEVKANLKRYVRTGWQDYLGKKQ